MFLVFFLVFLQVVWRLLTNPVAFLGGDPKPQLTTMTTGQSPYPSDNPSLSKRNHLNKVKTTIQTTKCHQKHINTSKKLRFSPVFTHILTFFQPLSTLHRSPPGHPQVRIPHEEMFHGLCLCDPSLAVGGKKPWEFGVEIHQGKKTKKERGAIFFWFLQTSKPNIFIYQYHSPPVSSIFPPAVGPKYRVP